MSKPLTMTAEEEAWLRSRCDCATHRRGADYPWQKLLRQARSEIDALRRLPVVATCGECGWHRPSNTRKAPDLCAHRNYPDVDFVLPPLGPSGAPPDECPLRGAT